MMAEDLILSHHALWHLTAPVLSELNRDAAQRCLMHRWSIFGLAENELASLKNLLVEQMEALSRS